jgi:hypothetical protein
MTSDASLNERLSLYILLEAEEEIEAVAKFFTDTIQWAGWSTAEI